LKESELFEKAFQVYLEIPEQKILIKARLCKKSESDIQDSSESEAEPSEPSFALIKVTDGKVLDKKKFPISYQFQGTK